MNIQAAQEELVIARKKARDLRSEITALRQLIIDAGGITHHSGIDHLKRNKKMYRQWKRGYTLRQVAENAKLSEGRASEICHRIDKILEYKKAGYLKYQSLLKYYEMAKRS